MNMKKISIIFTILFSAIIFAGAANAQTDRAGSPQETEKIYKLNEVDVKPKVKNKQQPKVEDAFGKCWGRGELRLRVVLHQSGEVRNVEVLMLSPCRIFNESALKLVKKLKFKPAMKDGQPVSMYQKIYYEYDVE